MGLGGGVKRGTAQAHLRPSADQAHVVCEVKRAYRCAEEKKYDAPPPSGCSAGNIRMKRAPPSPPHAEHALDKPTPQQYKTHL